MAAPIPYQIISQTVLGNCFEEVDKLSANNPNIRVRIDERKVPVSDAQRGYVFGGVYPTIKRYIYETTENRFDVNSIIHPYHVEAHNKECSTAMSKVFDLGLGEVEIRRRMSQWTKEPMTVYIDWLLSTYSARFGLYIESPDDWKRKRGLMP